MGKSLVIVESPAKAKTINKYLGSDYIVKSSIGHIRDLPTGGSKTPVDPKERAKAAVATRKLAPARKAAYKKERSREQLFSRMGINPEKNWEAHYEILPGKEKVVEELKKLARAADRIYLATDLDREGEAIAWHLKESIGGEDHRYSRVVFNEITKNAIQEAFAAPASLDMDHVNAQQARRFLDRVVGFMVSPLLWAKVARGLSAGRVQSVAVRLIVEREREIHAFNPEEYWEVYADVKTAAGAPLRLQVKSRATEDFRPANEAQTKAALAVLEQAAYRVASREDKPTKSKPPAPFITSTLQQAASTRLGFGVKKTMMMAQRLYEAGYITYMRTDSTNLSQEALTACRDYIGKTYGRDYLPPAPNVYSSKQGAQEAHEAIRPSSVTTLPTQLKDMERDAERLYTLIWRQFVAGQMPPAEFNSTTIIASAADFELRARGRIVTFDGYMKVLPPVAKKEEDGLLPEVRVGETLVLQQLEPSQHFTKGPPRYTEASLVRELEKQGIGRPSTYATIISTIQERGYVRVESKRFYAEKIGDIVTDRLVENFTDLMDYGFTANMEKTLDEIAHGNRDWKQVLDNFFADFQKKLAAAESSQAGMRSNTPVETDVACAKCGRPMQIRTGSTGVFLGCSGYALPPKERCKETLNLVHGDEVVHEGDDDEMEARLLRTRHRCQRCGTAMDGYLVDESRKLHVCGNNPDCPGFAVEMGRFKVKGYEGPVIECDKCGANMQLKSGRFGKYFGCSNIECKNTRKLLRNGEAAPPKIDPIPMPELKCQKVDDYYVLRDGATGLFLAASKFPKNRETRAPLVEEILPHRNEIDSKYSFLFAAPTADDQGNKTIIRFSRKTKEQYLLTEVQGKPTGWKAFYRNDKWLVDTPSQKIASGTRKKKPATSKKKTTISKKA